MPRPRATIFQRQARRTVMITAMSTAAAQRLAVDRTDAVDERASAQAPDEDGERRCDAREAGPCPHAPGSSRCPICSGEDQQVGVVHGDGELPGCGLRQTPARVGLALGGQLDLLLARGTHPSGEPLRRQISLGGAGRHGLGRPGRRLPAGRTARRRRRRHPGRAGGSLPPHGAGARRRPRPPGRRVDPGE